MELSTEEQEELGQMGLAEDKAVMNILHKSVRKIEKILNHSNIYKIFTSLQGEAQGRGGGRGERNEDPL